MLHDDGHHETDNPPACQGKIYCIHSVDILSETGKKVTQKETFSLLLQPGVSKDKIDRKLPSIYGKNINKKKKQTTERSQDCGRIDDTLCSPIQQERRKYTRTS